MESGLGLGLGFGLGLGLGFGQGRVGSGRGGLRLRDQVRGDDLRLTAAVGDDEHLGKGKGRG